jgi:hypothetical protein
MMKNNSFVPLVLLIILGSGCSHRAPKPESAAPSAAQTPSAPDDLALPKCGPSGCEQTINEYLKTVALPKILNSHVVHECFLENKRASKKELKPGFLSFRFEIKLVPEGKRVVPENVYLSSFQNVPEWTKPCLNKGYQKFSFPPFPDTKLESASAFGTINVNWNSKK